MFQTGLHLDTNYYTKDGTKVKIGDILEGQDIVKGVVIKTKNSDKIIVRFTDYENDCWIPIEHYLKPEYDIKITGSILNFESPEKSILI